jgi:hypothetical protein
MVDLHEMAPEPEPKSLDEKRPELETIFKNYLKDQESKIGLEEWNSFYLDLVRAGGVERAESLGDGEVKAGDLSDELKLELGAVFARVDKDKDGKVTFDEVFEFWQEKLAEEGEEPKEESLGEEAEKKDEAKEESKK